VRRTIQPSVPNAVTPHQPVSYPQAPKYRDSYEHNTVEALVQQVEPVVRCFGTEEKGENRVLGGEEEERGQLGESEEASAIGVGEQLASMAMQRIRVIR
jgi:hypothetical protein